VELSKGGSLEAVCKNNAFFTVKSKVTFGEAVFFFSCNHSASLGFCVIFIKKISNSDCLCLNKTFLSVNQVISGQAEGCIVARCDEFHSRSSVDVRNSAAWVVSSLKGVEGKFFILVDDFGIFVEASGTATELIVIIVEDGKSATSSDIEGRSRISTANSISRVDV